MILFKILIVITCVVTMSAFKKSLQQGGPVTAAEEKVDPIPRHLPSQSVTLNFTQRTWEELGPGELLYLQLAQTPRYMFDDAMRNQFNKFKELWHTMEIHKPRARISNLIMLQDDLRVQSNTPTDATAFTQVVYLLKYCPKGQKQYFKLNDHYNASNLQRTRTLKYKFGTRTLEAQTTKSQLVSIEGFKDFESLGIAGAKANYFAGFNPSGKVDMTLNVINDPYIPPNYNGQLAAASGNLRPKDNAANFIPPTNSITLARNQDSISFYKYGDVIDIPITTNIEGMQLQNNPLHNFLDDTYITEDNDKYLLEFCWPSRNRPFLNRGSYYTTNLDQMTEGKKFAPLSHCFFAMPPIKKPNGALLGQRCSFLLEQEISITFNFNQSTFFGTEEDDAMQTHQDDTILLRPNIYPKPVLAKPNPSIFCGTKGDSCKPEPPMEEGPLSKRIRLADPTPKCYEGTWKGLLQFCDDFKLTNTFNSYMDYARVQNRPSDALDVFEVILQTENLYSIDLSMMDKSDKLDIFKNTWIKAIDDNKPLSLWFSDQPRRNAYEEWIYFIGGDVATTLAVLPTKDWTLYPNYVKFDVNKWLEEVFFKYATNNLCYIAPPNKAPAAYDRTCTTFFL